MSRNRPTELAPSGHLRLTREAQVLLVAEAMAQVRPVGEVARTGVLGGVEAYTSESQKAWYRKELNKALRAGRKALAAAEAAASVVVEPEVPSVAEAVAVAYPVMGVDVLAGLSLGRTQQIEQRHYAGSVAEPKLRMGRKVLLPLREAAEKARAVGGRIVGFEHEGQIVGYRVYVGLGRNDPDAMSDCEPGWGVRYQGMYKGQTWFAGRTIESQPLISDPLKDPQQHQQLEQRQMQMTRLPAELAALQDAESSAWRMKLEAERDKQRAGQAWDEATVQLRAAEAQEREARRRWEAACGALVTGSSEWRAANEAHLDSLTDSPHQQPEQQQAQAGAYDHLSWRDY